MCDPIRIHIEGDGIVRNTRVADQHGRPIEGIRKVEIIMEADEEDGHARVRLTLDAAWVNTKMQGMVK